MQRYKSGLKLGIIITTLAMQSFAYALPSYSRQTGDSCSSCHVSGFGPQLTPTGIAFKLGGYTRSIPDAPNLKMSAALTATTTKSQENMPFNQVKPHYRSNNNSNLQDFSVYFAGDINKNMGLFSQISYSGVDYKTYLNTLDVRYAKAIKTKYFEKPVQFGISLNNDPTSQDPFNSLGTWRFPYIQSDVAPTPNALRLDDPTLTLDAATIIGIQNGTIDPKTLGPTTPSTIYNASASISVKPILEGRLTGSVLGLTSYALLPNGLYLDGGLYASQPSNMLTKAHVKTLDQLQGLSPYARAAYFKDLGTMNYSIGLSAMRSQRKPLNNKNQGADTLSDIGIDGSFQYLGNRKHISGASFSYINEQQNLDGSYSKQRSEFAKGHLNSTHVAGTYLFDQTYGLSLGLFDKRANADAGLYGQTDTGKRKTPNSNGYTLQLDWTPWGKQTSWNILNLNSNIHVGLQYTGYNTFNGASKNYDNLGRNASDNNTIVGFLWTAW